MKKKAEFMMLYGAIFPVLFVFVYICVFDEWYFFSLQSQLCPAPAYLL